MELALLIDKYLSDKAELRHEDDSFNIVNDSIFRWDFRNIACPTHEELLALQPEMEAQSAQKAINEASLKLLADTDWMVIRQLENGTLVPKDVLDARAAARASIIR